MSEGSYISFGVEGVPYSQVRIDLTGVNDVDAAVEYAVRRARLLADLYRVEFYTEATQATPVEREPVYDDHPNAPGNDPPRAAQRPPQTNGNAKGSGLFCPDHTRIELVETIAKYQTYDTVDGVEVPAKFFCPGDKNGTGANHSVWRSKALWPETATR